MTRFYCSITKLIDIPHATVHAKRSQTFIMATRVKISYFTRYYYPIRRQTANMDNIVNVDSILLNDRQLMHFTTSFPIL